MIVSIKPIVKLKLMYLCVTGATRHFWKLINNLEGYNVRWRDSLTMEYSFSIHFGNEEYAKNSMSIDGFLLSDNDVKQSEKANG